MNDLTAYMLIAEIARAVPAAPAESTNTLIWIALITMIGGIVKQYLDNRKVMGELALTNLRSQESNIRTENVAAVLKADTKVAADKLASKAEELHADIKIIKVEVNDRLSQLLASKDSETIAKVAAAHAVGIVEGKTMARESMSAQVAANTAAIAAISTGGGSGSTTDIAAKTAATTANTIALDSNTRGQDKTK